MKKTELGSRKAALREFAEQWAGALKEGGVPDNPELKWLADMAASDEAKFARALVATIDTGFNEMRKRRQTLLSRLANMSADSVAVRRVMSSFKPEWLDWITAAKKALQLLWPREINVQQKQTYVDLFMQLATQRSDSAVLAPLPFGHLEFGADNFPGQIVLAILENWTDMAVCVNPDCPERYFLAKRSTQRYCERGECTKYGLRKKAKKWWSVNRAKQKGGVGHAKGSNRPD